mmetsp:Transcript_135469/g.235583  ORF Transcript_135469/g.235583 Transcript_135469/m.235583 type:complete len:145 (-) Transcript_135469:129-563(-)
MAAEMPAEGGGEPEFGGDPSLMSAAPAAAVDEGTSAFPSQYGADGTTAFDKVEADLRGKPLRIICDMPDGTTQEIVECFEGHDVAYAKGLLSRQTDISYGAISFFLKDKLMFDPLSFNDFADVNAAEVVRIKVQITEEEKPVAA